MWKDFSADYIKNNRSSGLSVRLSAFISALLLSLLCGLFYNMWKYEVSRIVLTEGGWQSRITGEFNDDDLETIRNFAHVKDAVVNEKEGEAAIELYFDDLRSVLSGTPRIAELIGASPEKVVYNYQLLAMYLIRAKEDRAPRLVFPMFIVIVALASFSLIVIIHNSFAVSMNARIHQFGILSSIGATPKQIRSCLLQEAAILCAMPILTGSLLGMAGSMGIVYLTNVLLGSDITGRHKAVAGYHPLVLVFTLLITAITIWISAWLPAKKLSRLTPLEAIRNNGELQLERKRNFPALTLLFGVEGELAGSALKAQKKALRTASLSLIFSFIAFIIMQCFFSLSGISTRETYFERYQNVWDIMVTVKDAKIDTFDKTEALWRVEGVKSAVVYQKAMAKRMVTEEEISEEMKALGGFSHACEEQTAQVDGGWLINVPVIILDDNSFFEYCEQAGITPQADGAVILNRIRDVTNPDFRHPDFMPYLKSDFTEEHAISVLRRADGKEQIAEIPVLSYTEEVPALREEYATIDYYELVHFVPVSLWKKIKGQIGGAKEDLYIRILCGETKTMEELDKIQAKVNQCIGQTYVTESENRIREYETNNKQIQGLKTVLGGFCILLAVIGIGDIFSNTMGFVRQRKREFARYMSIGMTPKEIRKMFCVEAIILAGRPVLLALPVSVIAVGYMLKLSYVKAEEFLAQGPLIPIAVFMIAVLGAVALAYFFAWRNIRKIRLSEALRDDTMM